LGNPIENSVNDLFGEYFRSKGLNVGTQRGCSFPDGRTGTADFGYKMMALSSAKVNGKIQSGKI
jgi:hypothetical protein